MSDNLVTVMYRNQPRKLRHLAREDHSTGSGRTLCGKLYTKDRVLPIARRNLGDIPICGTCDRARKTTGIVRDMVLPALNENAATRGLALMHEGGILEGPGRVFRGAGSRDTYTVTVPLDLELASLCTCMAAKTHPEDMCKHQAAVYLSIGNQGNERERETA